MTQINLDAARNDLKKLFGLPPYDKPTNICLNDGYFAVALTSKHGVSIDQLCELTGVQRPR